MGSSKTAGKQIVIPEIKTKQVKVLVMGDTPLIVHAWSQKAKLEMLGKHMGEPKSSKKDFKKPWEDFQQSLYRLVDGGYGFPSVGFKNAAVTACTSIDGVTKTAARQAFHMTGEQIEVQAAYQHQGQSLTARYDMVRILGSEPEMREDMVRLSGIGRKPDIRYRAQFWPWRAWLYISFNVGVLTEAQILNLINVAGFAVGVGEWRPEKNGPHGRFRLATEAEAIEYDDGEDDSLAAAA